MMRGLGQLEPATRHEDDEVIEVRREPAPPRGRWLAALALAAYLLFCHGCHAGDHDNELLIRLTNAATDWLHHIDAR